MELPTIIKTRKTAITLRITKFLIWYDVPNQIVLF